VTGNPSEEVIDRIRALGIEASKYQRVSIKREAPSSGERKGLGDEVWR